MKPLKALILVGTVTTATLAVSGHGIAAHESGSGYGPGHPPAMGSDWHGYGPGYGHHGPHHGMAPHGEKRMDHMADYLDLSDKQRKSLEKIFQASHDKQLDLRDKLRDVQRDIRDALEEDAIDSAKINRLAEAKGKLVADRVRLHTDTWKQVRAALNGKQRKRMRNMDHYQYNYWNY